MALDWNFYLCNVNNVKASIALDLGLRESIPVRERPYLLWVYVELKSPREDGLSDSIEFEKLCAIEDALTEVLAKAAGAVHVGRITTDGRREFYFYAAQTDVFGSEVQEVMRGFPDYEFNFGLKADPEWTHYLDVLYPSEEQRQYIENRKVLDMLRKGNDLLKRPRDIRHWMYFRTAADRERFLSDVLPLEYRAEPEPKSAVGEFPFALCIVRFQSISQVDVDNAVIELFRLTKAHGGDYDGWETEVISEPS